MPAMIIPQTLVTPAGCILYDAACVRKAQEDLFDLKAWSARNAVERVAGGRGSVAIIRQEAGRWVLRHYCRGGFIAKVSKDRYVWMGAERTRSFAEWHILARLHAIGLPVPRPIAARYLRRGLTYSADLITEYLENTITLAQALSADGVGAALWRQIGETVAKFHVHGVHHADLNAHNILLSGAEAPGATPHVYLLDFDRGRIRSRGPWEQQVLQRLRRSLDKVCTQVGCAFDEAQWEWMMEGYRVGER
jgi:3-deoxy-D-manno-octulosonic acid kinase